MVNDKESRGGGNPLARKIGWYVPPRPENDGPRELDGILCHHRTSRCSTLGSGLVQDGVPCRISKGGNTKIAEHNARQSEEALKETLACAPVQVARHLRQVTNTGA